MKAERLTQRGYQALGELEYERSMKIGKRMKYLRHTSAFEIMGCRPAYRV